MSNSRLRRRALTCLTIPFALAAWHPQAHAFQSLLIEFNATYGTSGTRLDSCLLCHTGTFGFNPYGADYRDANGPSAIETIDSDGDGFVNIVEIAAFTFPGDPNDFPSVVNQLPIADANGPYSGTVGTPLQFDGSGSSDPDGTIVAYQWSFGDGTGGSGVSPSHSYAASGSYTVTLTVTDDAGATDTSATTATIGIGNQAPSADPNGPYSGTVGIAVQFDASGSSDVDGTIVAYNWDFGDGTSGSGVNPSHSYAAAGVYNVTLTVMDDAGATDAGGTTATIGDAPNLPPVADANGPYSGVVGTPVTFDGSGSSDADGSIVRYDWAFGDGTTATDAGPTPSHSYPSAGSYTVTLTVTDDAGATATDATTANIAIAPNLAPIADANGPYSGTLGSPVEFDASGSSDPDGSIVAFAWSFGDGATGTGISPSHTYTSVGSYTVTLTVTDDAGATAVDTTAAAIGVGNQPPIAEANGPYSGTVGLPVQFDGSGSSDPDGAVVSYSWSFGDGSSGAGVSPSHSYAMAGTYNVTLTVTDAAGASDSATTTVTITDVVTTPPPADDAEHDDDEDDEDDDRRHDEAERDDDRDEESERHRERRRDDDRRRERDDD